ncbi:trehalose 6-phosphate phosphatase [Luteibacter jiangsuensis]|uniref:Trehalose 6-phosphate phosphatase n=1 Tax=Luteibacter jiangsuensis TaxID=637577 RepID=A0ABT9T3R7_9GAMM|nr:trehalose-phosphatase [Luteibacter jiangsuensis]MDQ0011635.1 trehalose 6-phosphate phosphatase [Luteibacter jiangsuensis]
MTAARDILPPPPADLVTPGTALFLDADGTLLAFADDPDGVFVPPGMLDTLDTLHRVLGGAMALVSGRAIAGLDRIFDRTAWAAAGQHGLERRDGEGHTTTIPVDTEELARLRYVVHDIASALPGVRVEDKSWSVALHCREHPEREDELDRIAPAIAARFPAFELQPGSYVYEFKPKGMDKGVAVAGFLDTPPFRGRTPVYLGDDLTDEHAFAVVNERGGASVRVGTRTPSHATFTLPSPAAVHAWLDSVNATLTQGAARAR